jgi:hypothetical protein
MFSRVALTMDTSGRTTGLYDQRGDQISPDEVERTAI